MLRSLIVVQNGITKGVGWVCWQNRWIKQGTLEGVDADIELIGKEKLISKKWIIEFQRERARQKPKIG